MRTQALTIRPLTLTLGLALGGLDSAASAAEAAAERAIRWADAVSAAQLTSNWAALEQTTLAHGGDRSAGSAGYEASARYVEARLHAMGIDVRREPFTYNGKASFNLIAEIAGSAGADAPVVMVGAHLDSVPGSPGADDNGSGSSAVLEIARVAMLDRTTATLQLAWWGAEESGLNGSIHHATLLAMDPGRRQRLRVYLNADMVGSPNYIFGIYDPDHTSSGDRPAQERLIRQALRDGLGHTGNPSISISPYLGSDHLPFAACGIATGGLASIPGIRNKTPEEQALFGGEAGKRHSPNYHRPGDRVGAGSATAQLTLTRALAYALGHLAEQPPEATPAARCNLRKARQQWEQARAVLH